VLLPLPASARRRAPAVLAAGARHRAPALVVAPHASDPSPPPGSAACPTEGRVFQVRGASRAAALAKRGLHRPATYIEGLGLDRAARELSRAAGRLRERTWRAMRNRWADTRARVRYRDDTCGHASVPRLPGVRALAAATSTFVSILGSLADDGKREAKHRVQCGPAWAPPPGTRVWISLSRAPFVKS
jgi:hypothetical protein